jgi:hypothetical protein
VSGVVLTAGSVLLSGVYKQGLRQPGNNCLRYNLLK